MCNIKYGMNLRYANMWDMPLRFLASARLRFFAGYWWNWRRPIMVGAVALICGVELNQYIVFAVHYPLYELVPQGLLRALRILK